MPIRAMQMRRLKPPQLCQISAMPASLTGAAKGIAYIVFERLGSVPTSEIAHLARNMHETDNRFWRV